jgi:hypothetical protein
MTKRRRIFQAATPEGQLAGEALLEAIENQLRDNNPPEVSKTLKRLLGAGYSREDALRLIGAVLATEVYEIVHENRTFDERRYVTNLKALPNLPQAQSDEI